MHLDTAKAGDKNKLLSTNCPQGKCKGWFVEKSSFLAPTLGLTILINVTDMIFVTLSCVTYVRL
jgi:hypothetical protein